MKDPWWTFGYVFGFVLAIPLAVLALPFICVRQAARMVKRG